MHQIASILEQYGAHTNPHHVHNQLRCSPCSDALHFITSNFNISFLHRAESGIIPTRKLSHQIPTPFNLIIYFISFLQTNALNFNHKKKMNSHIHSSSRKKKRKKKLHAPSFPIHPSGVISHTYMRTCVAICGYSPW